MYERIAAFHPTYIVERNGAFTRIELSTSAALRELEGDRILALYPLEPPLLIPPKLPLERIVLDGLEGVVRGLVLDETYLDSIRVVSESRIERTFPYENDESASMSRSASSRFEYGPNETRREPSIPRASNHE